MFDLKPLSREAIPRALEKAERYRVLNEPREAESICLDILAADSENQPALAVLLLALTDQFESQRAVRAANEVLGRLAGDYERAYYTGILFERRAKARMEGGQPGSGHVAYDWFRQALEWFEKAEALRPAGNDDARLRWNTCVRILQEHPELRPAPVETVELPLE